MILSHFENEKTTELENFKSAKEDITVAYDRAHKLATKIVQRAYPTSDVATLQAFKKNMVVRVMLLQKIVVSILLKLKKKQTT